MTPLFGRRAVKRTVGVPASIVLAASLFVAFVGTGSAEADPTTCTAPPGALLTFHANFTNGSTKIGRASANNLNAKACGSISMQNGQLISTVATPDITFDPIQVKVLFLKLPTTITANAAVSGPVQLGPGLATVDLTLTTDLTAKSKILAFTCDIGLKPTITTGASGSLTGTTFTGSVASGFTGKVVANDFAVPAIQRTRSCPGLIAGLSNSLVGLPSAPGKASIQMDGAIKIP